MAMPYGVQRSVRPFEPGKPNRFLAALGPDEQALLTPHLRPVSLERGAILHEAGDEIDQIYFPRSGMVSLVAVMRNGGTVETATIGRGGVIGATAGLGSHQAF